MSENEKRIKEVKCPICGSVDVAETGSSENSFGLLVQFYLCNECDIEFENEFQY